MRRVASFADLLLLLVVVTWGAHFAVVKQALSEVDPMAFSLVRFTVAAFLLLVLVRIVEGRVILPKHQLLPMLGLGLVGAANQVLWMYGLSGTTSGKSALLLATAPAFLALMRAAGGERVGPRSAISLALAFVGVALIVDVTGTSEHLVGDILTLLAAIMWALYANSGPRMLARHSALIITAYVFAVTAVVTAVPGLGLIAAGAWSGVGAAAWYGLAYSTLLAGSLCWVLWYRGISELGPIRVMLYQYLVPVVALTVSILWLGEPLLPQQALGAVMVLIGTAGARLSLKAPPPEAAPPTTDSGPVGP